MTLERERKTTTGVRYWMYQTLASSDGERCASCKKEGIELIIDHIDGNRQNNARSNLRLLCRSCNAKNYTTHSNSTVNDRENISAEVAAVEAPRTPISIAQDKEPLYFQWLIDNVGREKGLTMWDAIYEGADEIGIGVLTARHYLYKKLATTYELGPGNRGHKLIRERKT